MTDDSVRQRTKTPVFAVAGREPSQAPSWSLLIAASPDPKLNRLSIPREGIVLGRAPTGGPGRLIEIEDEGASRSHVRISASGGEVSVEDLGSTNGTFVNTRRIATATVRSGDVIRFGATIGVVTRHESTGEGTPAASTLIGCSDAMVDLRRLVALSGPSALPVLIVGPTGTGKELVACAVHDASGRRGEFVAVNCAALPSTLVESALFGHRRGAFTDARSDEPGAFVRAHGGTLFLDEIGEMPVDAQPKLLRALETGEVMPVGATRPTRVDVRLVAATNQTLDQTGLVTTLREDLHARLAGIVMMTPPLSRRREDIIELFRAFMHADSAGVHLHPDFVEALLTYDWPRNVRELKRLAERLPVLHPNAEQWRVDMLDPAMRAPPASPVVDTSVTWPPTRESLITLLTACDGNVSQAAEMVGRNRKQLYRWMERYGLATGSGR